MGHLDPCSLRHPARLGFVSCQRSPGASGYDYRRNGVLEMSPEATPGYRLAWVRRSTWSIRLRGHPESRVLCASNTGRFNEILRKAFVVVVYDIVNTVLSFVFFLDLLWWPRHKTVLSFSSICYGDLGIILNLQIVFVMVTSV